MTENLKELGKRWYQNALFPSSLPLEPESGNKSCGIEGVMEAETAADNKCGLKES